MSPLLFQTRQDKNCFFGYYDKSPINRSGTRMLCLRTDFSDREAEAGDSAEIGYWELASGRFVPLSTTRAFNFQQGCMLQWLGPDFDRRIIYNDQQDDHFVSVILDTETGEKRIIPHPVYVVHPSGKWAVTIDFERHYFTRKSYAYAGIVRPEKDVPCLAGDGIFRIDLDTGDQKRIISLEQMMHTRHVATMDGQTTSLVHMMFNPSGNRFMFYHRWSLADGGTYTRIYTSDGEGRDIRCVLDSGKATHSCWKDDDTLTVWGARPNAVWSLRRHKAAIKWLLRPLLHVYHKTVNPRSKLALSLVGGGYLLCPDKNGGKPQKLDTGPVVMDGHPSWSQKYPNLMLTDTYQDLQMRQHIYILDFKSHTQTEVAALPTSPDIIDSGFRCDLHPRWDWSGTRIIVDSQHQEKRAMCVFDVRNLIPEVR